MLGYKYKPRRFPWHQCKCTVLVKYSCGDADKLRHVLQTRLRFIAAHTEILNVYLSIGVIEA